MFQHIHIMTDAFGTRFKFCLKVDLTTWKLNKQIQVYGVLRGFKDNDANLHAKFRS